MNSPSRPHILLAGLLWSVLLLATASPANAGQILGAPLYIGLNSGLVGYWSFNGDDIAVDSSHAVTAYDRSGNGNHSNRATAATAPERVLGKIGQALDFNENDSHIDIDSDTHPGLNNLPAVSASFWLYSRSTPDFGELVIKAFSETQRDGWNLLDCGCGDDDILFIVGYDGASDLEVRTNTHPIRLNQWQHIAVTWDGSSNGSGVTIYIDGAATPVTVFSNGAGARTDDSASGNDLVIGNDNGQSAAWDGLIDEVRVYHRPLTADEVKRLYKIGSTEKLGVSNSTGSLASGLVGWWTFDGNDMAQNNSGLLAAYDRSGNGNTASSTSAGVTPVKSSGRIGQALSFDGSNDRLLVGDSSSLDISGGGSIASWFRLDSAGFGTFRAIASKGTANADEEHNYHLKFLDNDELFCNVGNETVSDNHSTNFDFLDTDWHHAVCTWDGTNFSIYVDGVFRESSTQTVIPAGNTDRLQIGDWGTGGDNYQGIMDDLRIYNRALSPSEIKRLYKMGDTLRQGIASDSGGINNGLVGYWSFDGKDTAGNIAYDRSGQGNNGTLTNGPARTVGKIGQALEFDQVDDYVSLGNMDVAGSAMTISAWVYQGTVPNGADCFAFADCRIVDKSGGTAEQDIFWMLSTIWDGSKPVLRARLSTSGTTHTLIASSGEVKDGEWTHAVMRYDGSTLKLYKDVVEVGSMSKTGPIDTVDFWPAAIGVAAQSETLNWLGKIDDVRIYNRALSTDDLKRLYNMGR